MRFKRVLLANLISHEGSFFTRRAVLRAGLGYIAQSLEDNGIEHEVLDLSLGYGVRDMERKISEFKPDLIGVTLFTYKYRESYDILKRVKAKFGDIRILAGGPHISTFKEEVLKECPELDFAIAFEGEVPVVDLCKGEDLETIGGLIYRKAGGTAVNPHSGFIQDLDGIAFPRYGKFELGNYPLKNSPVSERIIPLVTSRGCPYDCVYCTVQAVMGKRFRYRSVGSVIKEIEHWHRKGYRKFSFVDDNFTLVKSRVMEFCRELGKSGMRGLYLTLPNGIRADKTDHELLKEMSAAGFREIGIGVEGGNDNILKNLNKNEKLETIEKAVGAACALGYDIDLYFLVGSPGETKKDVMDSIALATKYPVNNVFFFNLIPYPKTALFRWVEANGKFVYSPEYYLNNITSNMNIPVFETPEFSSADRKAMLKYAKKAFSRHKTSIYRQRLESKGFPRLMAATIAGIYSVRLVQILFNDVKAFRKIKDRLWPPRRG